MAKGDRGKLLKGLSEDKKLQSVTTGVSLGAERPPLTWITTGNYALDWAIADRLFNGGLPLGRVVELFGDPSAGKSLIVAKIMGVVQAMGGIAIYDDVEEARDEEFMARMGCDTSKEALMTMCTKTVEEHYKAVMCQMNYLRDKGFDKPIVIVLDSLAALSTKHEVETGLDKVDMARAKVIKAAMRLVGGDFSKKDVLYIVNNHTIANIGQTRASKINPAKTSPGGGGVKFQASVRVELAVKELYQDAKNLVTGVKVQADVVKNKLAPPFRRVYLDCYFDRGIDEWSGLFDVLVQEGSVIQPSPGWYSYKGSKNMRREEVMEQVKKEVMGGGACDDGGSSDGKEVEDSHGGNSPATVEQ